jgi:hypothetical protein
VNTKDIKNLSRYMPWRRMAGEEISSYSYLTSALDGVSGQHHALTKDINLSE